MARKAHAFAKGGSTDSKTEHYRFLELTPSIDGLTIKLTEEGKEKVAEDGLTEHNFDEYFEDVQGNSEYRYIFDAGEAGLGMTSAPAITDGYYYDDDSVFTDNIMKDSSRLFVFMNYQIVDFTDKLKEDGEVFFPEHKKHQMGGTTRTRTFVPKHNRGLSI